jgi:deoxyhypusine synthase
VLQGKYARDPKHAVDYAPDIVVENFSDLLGYSADDFLLRSAIVARLWPFSARSTGTGGPRRIIARPAPAYDNTAVPQPGRRKDAPVADEFLVTPIQRFAPDGNASLRSFIDALARTGGQPRRLASAIALWDAMLERNRVVFCSVAGAPVPLGFGPAIASFIDDRRIDVLDITGAQLTHDMLEIIGSRHFQGQVQADDAALARHDVNRFWDTFGDEADYRRVEPMIFEFARALPDRPMTTREYIYRLGRFFAEIGSQEGILTAAARTGVPVYCPAIGDSVLGMDLGFLWVKEGKRVVFDVVQDVLEMAAIVLLAEEVGLRTSTVIFGGGAPRNHVQQSQIGSYMFSTKSKGHAEAVRFSIEPAETGGLSGSTISEGISWKKFDPEVESAEVFLDSNLSIAIAASLVGTRDAASCFNFRHEDDGTLTVLFEGREYNLSEKFQFLPAQQRLARG